MAAAPNMQPVIGTMNEGRLVECIKASDIHLIREEWYSRYHSVETYFLNLKHGDGSSISFITEW